ncbi:hypothetical protein LTS12_026792, partial [Elasticomyces elasticus]
MPAATDNEALSDNTPPQTDLPTWFPQPIKKKGKKKKHVRRFYEDEEATPYVEPVTASSAPASNGVKLDDPEPEAEPVRDLVDIAFDDEQAQAHAFDWQDDTGIADETYTTAPNAQLVCFSYTAVNAVDTTRDLTADLTLAAQACSAYGKEINDLT